MKINVNDNIIKLFELIKRLEKLEVEKQSLYDTFFRVRNLNYTSHEWADYRKKVRIIEKKIDGTWDKIIRICDEVGIEFGCCDYGDEQCLSINALSMILKVTFNMGDD